MEHSFLIFRAKLGEPNEGSLKNSNLYNDKELFEDADLNWYDYGFRNYDPQIGRFPQLDPLTDEYPYYTPYQYAGNEPIANVDLDGLEEFKVLAPVVVPGLSKSAQSASVNIFKLSTQIIPKISQITAVHSEQSLVKLQIQSFPPKAKEAPTFSQRQDYFVSDIQKSVNAQKTFEAGYNPDGSKMFWARAAENKTWNNFANNIVFSPVADVAGLAVGLGELRFALKYAAKGVTNLIPEGKLANHLFKGAGKLADNPANRRLIQNISNGKALGVDAFGKSWYTGFDAAGKSIYSYGQNGIIKGAGYMNMTPAEMIIKYGLK